MRTRIYITAIILFVLTVAVLSDLGCDSSTTIPGNTVRIDKPFSTAHRGALVSGYLDQYCDGSAVAWKNIQKGNLTGQSFTPRAGARKDCGCNFLVGIEVGLVTGNTGRGGDSVTLSVINVDGVVLTSVSEYIEGGFNGFFYFDLPGNGIRITAGAPLLLRLEDTGKVVFGWQYVGGNCYADGSRYEGGDCGLPEFGGNLCRQGKDYLFRTYCDYPPEIYQIRELTTETIRLVANKGISNSLRAHLDNSLRVLENCDRKSVVARRALEAYIHEIDALPSPMIDPADADALIESARLILDVIPTDDRASGPDEPRKGYRMARERR